MLTPVVPGNFNRCKYRIKVPDPTKKGLDFYVNIIILRGLKQAQQVSVGNAGVAADAQKGIFAAETHAATNQYFAKQVIKEELPRPYRILSPFSPYTRWRTHKRLTVYVDKNNFAEDVECS